MIMICLPVTDFCTAQVIVLLYLLILQAILLHVHLSIYSSVSPYWIAGSSLFMKWDSKPVDHSDHKSISCFLSLSLSVLGTEK